jgi:hypothetical protein
MRSSLHTSPAIVRLATDADAPALQRLAALDSSRVPAGAVLVAAAGGELRAALSLDTGASVADPFYPSAGLVEVLRVRAAPARDARPLRRARPRLRLA